MLLRGPVRVGPKTDPKRLAWKPPARQASEHAEPVPARFRKLRLRRRVRFRTEGAPLDAWIVLGVLLAGALILLLPHFLG